MRSSFAIECTMKRGRGPSKRWGGPKSASRREQEIIFISDFSRKEVKKKKLIKEKEEITRFQSNDGHSQGDIQVAVIVTAITGFKRSKSVDYCFHEQLLLSTCLEIVKLGAVGSHFYWPVSDTLLVWATYGGKTLKHPE